MTKNLIEPSFINSNGVLFQEDCMRVMSCLSSETVDCIFADPPFNLNKSYSDTKYIDRLERFDYEQWSRQWLFECIRILKPGGSLFVYHIPPHLIWIATFLNSIPALTFKNWIAVNMKNNFPIKNRLHPAHYGLLYYVKNGKKNTFNVVRSQTPVCRHCKELIKDYGGYRKKFKKWEDEAGIPWIQISDFWEDTRPARHDKKRELRINELPYEIPERAILMTTHKRDIVFDPFGGSGSTYYAASVNDRFWIGSEIGNNMHIIKRLFEYKTEFRNECPAEIEKAFKETDLIKNLCISPEKRKKIMKLLEKSKDALALNRIKQSNGRYSHRMSNRIFE